jgi:hypothetical protein
MLKCSTYLPLFALDLNYGCRLLFKLLIMLQVEDTVVVCQEATVEAVEVCK